MHMMIPLQECIVIVLLSVHAARSLGIWERLLAASRPESSPFQLCHQQHVAAEPNRRRLVWPAECNHSNGRWRDDFLIWWWWWCSTCTYDLRVSIELYCDYGTSILFLFGFLEWSARLHNSQTTNRQPCCNTSARVFNVNKMSPRFFQPVRSLTWCAWRFRLRRFRPSVDLSSTCCPSLYVVPLFRWIHPGFHVFECDRVSWWFSVDARCSSSVPLCDMNYVNCWIVLDIVII